MVVHGLFRTRWSDCEKSQPRAAGKHDVTIRSSRIEENCRKKVGACAPFTIKRGGTTGASFHSRKRKSEHMATGNETLDQFRRKTLDR